MKIPFDEIGFDFDGVVADTGEAFIRLAGDYGYNSFALEDITSFEVEKCLDIPHALVTKIFTDILVDSLGSGVIPIAGALELLSEMAQKGRVHIVTARSLAKPVEEWFDEYFPDSVRANLNIVVTSDHDNKARYIRDIGLKYFVDDRQQTCEQLIEDNINAIVFSQPWNLNSHALPQVSGWKELREIIQM